MSARWGYRQPSRVSGSSSSSSRGLNVCFRLVSVLQGWRKSCGSFSFCEGICRQGSLLGNQSPRYMSRSSPLTRVCSIVLAVFLLRDSQAVKPIAIVRPKAKASMYVCTNVTVRCRRQQFNAHSTWYIPGVYVDCMCLGVTCGEQRFPGKVDYKPWNKLRLLHKSGKTVVRTYSGYLWSLLWHRQ